MSYRNYNLISDATGVLAQEKALGEIAEGAGDMGKPPEKKEEDKKIKDIAQDITPTDDMTVDDGSVVPGDVSQDSSFSGLLGINNRPKPFYKSGGPINNPNYFEVDPVTEPTDFSGVKTVTSEIATDPFITEDPQEEGLS